MRHEMHQESNMMTKGCAIVPDVDGNVVIPNTTTIINTHAFHQCHSLISIIIPTSVTEIGFMAFHGATSLTSAEVDGVMTQGRASAGVVMHC